MINTPSSIRSAAIALASKIGIMSISRTILAEHCGFPEGSFAIMAGCSFTELIESIRPECAEPKGLKVSKNRVHPSLRAESLLSTAVDLAVTHGYNAKGLRKVIAEEAGVSESLVFARLGTMANMQRDIMRRAIDTKSLRIIAQGLAAGDPHARKAPQELKDAAVALIATA